MGVVSERVLTVRSKREDVEGPKSEVGVPSAQCARHEMKLKGESRSQVASKSRNKQSNIKSKDI